MTKWVRQWTNRYQEVEIDLDAFTDEQLLQELIDRGRITADEAVVVSVRPKEDVGEYGAFQYVADRDYFEMAMAEARRGRPEEARLYLERALGQDFMGVFG